MSKSLQKTFHFLRLISQIKNEKKRKVLMKEICEDETIYKALSEIAKNQIKGNIKLDKKQSKKLKRHSKLLKKLCLKKDKITLKKRKNLVVQSGGFLPLLLPTVALILGSILNR